jgi:hypothetical protein
MIATQQRQNFRTNNRKPSHAEVLRNAQFLVDRFLVYLRNENVDHDILDTDELPAEKEALVNAFRLLIATESREDVRDKLLKVGLRLACFQPYIGERMSLQPVPADSMRSAEQVKRDMERHRDEIARFDRAFEAAASERQQLYRMFIASTRSSGANASEPEHDPMDRWASDGGASVH